MEIFEQSTATSRTRSNSNGAGVDSVTIGYKNTAEVDEAIQRMSRVLNG